MRYKIIILSILMIIIFFFIISYKLNKHIDFISIATSEENKNDTFLIYIDSGNDQGYFAPVKGYFYNNEILFNIKQIKKIKSIKLELVSNKSAFKIKSLSVENAIKKLIKINKTFLIRNKIYKWDGKGIKYLLSDKDTLNYYEMDDLLVFNNDENHSFYYFNLDNDFEYNKFIKNNIIFTKIKLILIFILCIVFILTLYIIFRLKINMFFKKIRNSDFNIFIYNKKLFNIIPIELLKNKIFQAVFILLIFLIPSSINIKNSHNWGDDFTQYITQAKNIVKGIPQDKSNMVFDKYTRKWGYPKFVSPGFPLILSIGYFIFGNSIYGFNILISIFFFFVCILVFIYYRLNFKGFIFPLFLSLVFAFNPWVLNFKASVLTEIPFIFFMLLSIVIIQYYYKNNLINILVLSLLIGYALAIRIAGVPILFALITYPIVVFLFKKNDKPLMYYMSFYIIVCLAVLFYWSFNRILFNLPRLDFAFSELFRKIRFENCIKSLKNIVLLFFTVVPKSNFLFISKFAFFVIMISFGIGLIFKLKNKPEVADLYVIFYIAMFVYLKIRSNAAYFRYLFPILPFFIFYIFYFLNLLFNIWKKSSLLIFICLLILLIYIPRDISIYSQSKTIIDGPQLPEAIECFDYIKNNIDDNSIIVFRKPRALALYTEKQTHPVSPFLKKEKVEDIEKKYNEIDIDYILYDKNMKKLRDERSSYRFIMESKKIKNIWENSRFVLFKYYRDIDIK